MFWAYSKTALRGIRIAEVRVQFPVGPQSVKYLNCLRYLAFGRHSDLFV